MLRIERMSSTIATVAFIERAYREFLLSLATPFLVFWLVVAIISWHLRELRMSRMSLPRWVDHESSSPDPVPVLPVDFLSICGGRL